MDMELLKQQFYDVMHKYEIPFAEKGVMENLEGWWAHKQFLYTLLSKHPNWDEQALALVFRFSEERELDHNIVDEAKFEMMELARECGIQSLCGSLAAIRFCPWTELMATTARQVV